MFKKLIYFITVIFVMGCSTASHVAKQALPPGSAIAEKKLEKLDKKLQLLFVHSAESGVIKPIANEPDTYLLILNKVKPKTLYFSDRPQRVAGHVTTEKFVKNWNKGKDSFKKDHPNADLAFKLDGISINKVITISNPKHDIDNQTLTYKFKLINSEKPILKELAFNKPFLFVDCIGSGSYNIQDI